MKRERWSKAVEDLFLEGLPFKWWLMCTGARDQAGLYREATGPCKARTLAQKRWAGEEYYLQLDAHMRFTPGRDEDLIQWLHGIENERPGSQPVLSTYPPGYEVRPSCRLPS